MMCRQYHNRTRSLFFSFFSVESFCYFILTPKKLTIFLSLVPPGRRINMAFLALVFPVGGLDTGMGVHGGAISM